MILIILLALIWLWVCLSVLQAQTNTCYNTKYGKFIIIKCWFNYFVCKFVQIYKAWFFGIWYYFFTRSSSKLTAPSSVKNVRLQTTSFGIGGNCSSLNGCFNRVTQTSSSSSNYDSNMLLFLKIYIYIFIINQYTNMEYRNICFITSFYWF